MIEIPLGRRTDIVGLIDNEDAELVLSFNWRAIPGKRGTFYVARRSRVWEKGEGETVYLHRWLMQCPLDMDVDHIDGDGLNNQRYNLEIVTQTENNRRAGERTRLRNRELPWPPCA